MHYYLMALKKYAQFSGRSGRSEYWYFFLFNFIFLIAATFADNLLGIADAASGAGPLYFLYVLALFIPGLAAAVRRLHDVNKSGAYIFILFIPFVGAIWLIVLLATKGDPYENKYGINPDNYDDLISSVGNGMA